MLKNTVNIRVYSDMGNTSDLTDIVRDLKARNYNISNGDSVNFTIEPEDIIIAKLSRPESNLLQEIVKAKGKYNNDLIAIVDNNKAVIASLLAKQGVTDQFVLPDELQKFREFVTLRIEKKSSTVTNKFTALDQRNYVFSSIIGTSNEASEMIELAKKVAKNNSVNILIFGETGTGKGLLAKAIHDYGFEDDSPYVDINCTAIPENLLEGELFGYERGAYTGATQRKIGLFEVAENGTIFLDEIGDMSLGLQAKLLRVVEKKIIRRLGGVEDIPVNARVISATNKNLEELVEEKLFRRDLYYRLNAVTLTIPPIRERGNDILHLTEHFILEFSKSLNKTISKIDRDLIAFLINYPWPGNIRELRNAIERAVVLADDYRLKLKYFENLIKTFTNDTINIENPALLPPSIVRLDLDFENTPLNDVNKMYAKHVLQKLDGNKTRTSKTLGITRPTLDKLLAT